MYSKPVSFFCLFTICLLLSACATPYAPLGHPGGYTDMALAPDIYKVTFNGNGYTSQDMVQNYTLRRCAEVTLRQGYNYFVLLAGNNSVKTGYITTPTTIQSKSYGNYRGSGDIYGNPAFSNYTYNGNSYRNTYTTINPGYTQQIDKHGTVVIIKLLKSNKKAPMALDARTILSNYAVT